MLELIDLEYFYGNFKAIESFSAKLTAGDFIILLGPNGAGKTTLLKSLAGVYDDYNGNIILNGTAMISDSINYKKQIGFVADEPMVIEYLSGRQFLNFIADMYEVPEHKRKKLINYYVKAFNLEDCIDNLIVSYSHGNRQKISLIAAFIHEPKLLLIDEPFIGLDPLAINTLMEVLVKLNESGTTIILSSHILSIVEKIGNKIIFVNKGKFKLEQHTHDYKKIEKKYEEYLNV